MKLTQETTPGLYRISAYEATQVTIDRTPYPLPVALSAHQVLDDWRPQGLARLDADAIAALLVLQPSVVLIGAGTRPQPLHPAILRPLIDAGIGYEVMDLGAACRTFNLLVGEGRAVVAALLGDAPD